MKANTSFNEKVERLIEISNRNPLLPDTFIPWETAYDPKHEFMPKKLLSLYGDFLFDTLTPDQQKELAKAEIAQVMYSYAWSEGLACLFFFRYLVTIKDITSPEYRYLLIEAAEESRHQQMFSRAVKKLDVEPLRPRFIHRLAASFATKFLPADMLFMSVLGIELVTDVYGTALRQEEGVHPILAKVSQLHNIEEGRHIHFTELLLERYTKKAGVIRRSLYSIVVCLNIYFMRTMYVRKEIFRKIGVDPTVYYSSAYKGLKKKFAEHCLVKSQEFVKSFNGFNWFTKIFWRVFLNAKV